jgi:hypothetical protein
MGRVLCANRADRQAETGDLNRGARQPLDAAQGGSGELLPIDALTVRCRMPRNRSIACALNSPRSAIAIRGAVSALRNRSKAVRKQAEICSEISSICRNGICSRAFLRSVSTAESSLLKVSDHFNPHFPWASNSARDSILAHSARYPAS